MQYNTVSFFNEDIHIQKELFKKITDYKIWHWITLFLNEWLPILTEKQYIYTYIIQEQLII
jgi:hypothetical protein